MKVSMQASTVGVVACVGAVAVACSHGTSGAVRVLRGAGTHHDRFVSYYYYDHSYFVRPLRRPYICIHCNAILLRRPITVIFSY